MIVKRGTQNNQLSSFTSIDLDRTMSRDIIPQEELKRSKKDKKQKKAKKSADPASDEPRGLHSSLQPVPLLTGHDKPAEKKDKEHKKKKHQENHDLELITAVSEGAKMDVEPPEGMCPERSMYTQAFLRPYIPNTRW